MEVNSKKDDIIIEVGSEWLRIGLVGQKVPRKTFRSKAISRILKSPQEKEQNLIIMDELLCNIFFIYLSSTTQNKTVILLEKVYTPRFVLEMMGKIMFNKLKIQKIEFSLSCVTPLYLTAKYTGIVISSGASCTEIMPVFDGYPLFRNYVYIEGGSFRVNKVIKEELIIMNPDANKEILAKITDEQITDIKNNYGIIPFREKEIVIPFKKTKLKFNLSKIKFEILFGNYQNEESNIAYSFLTMLDSLPVDCLDDLCKNIVFSGGLWRVEGMQNYFKKQISAMLPKFKRLENLEIRKKLSFVSWGFNPSELAWIGCSIGASVRNIEHLCLRRSQFQENNRFIQKLMLTYFLSS